MAQKRAFCFTWNNPPEDYQDLIDDFVEEFKARYVCFQLELSASNTPHVQGYVEFDRGVRFTTLQSFCADIHWEGRRGTAVQARNYCRKDDTRVEGPFEVGIWTAPEPGKRNDLESAIETLKEESMQGLIANHPATYVRYHAGLHKLEAALTIPPKDPSFKPRPWQQHVLTILSQTPNDRSIHWVHDTDGGKGKSRLTRHLVMEHGAILLTGKTHDMTYAYSGQPIVVFDIARSSQEFTDHLYVMAENLKNGITFSGKYDKGQSIFKTPHVIFFSNSYPKDGAWSHDRLKLLDLDTWQPVHAVQALAGPFYVPAPNPWAFME